MKHYLFILADDCAVIEWYYPNGTLAQIVVSDLRHTRAAGGPINIVVDENLDIKRTDT